MSDNPKSRIPNPDKDPKPFDLRERALNFAIRMVRIAASLPMDSEGAIIRRQIARAGTSIGANIEEADGAITKKDKRKSFGIARKETREVRYWLRIVQRIWPKGVDVDSDLQEAKSF